VSVLNRTVRRGSTLSPSQLFFDASNGIDVRRDLRASIGEVVLYKSPKRGVASEISVMRSEWGIVISRSFNGTGVLVGYFFESKSYGFRFKFERMAVPAYAMHIARGLTLPPGPIVHEQLESVPALLTPDAYVSGTAPAAATNDNDDLAIVGPILPDAILDVLSAQISYRKALLTFPDRAVSAMEEEVRMLFGVKRLGRPVHLADIPLAERKFGVSTRRSLVCRTVRG
jgi:hypothetical protein